MATHKYTPSHSFPGGGAGGGGSGANQALSNLTSPTAINQDLIPSGSRSLGSPSAPWAGATIGVLVNSGGAATIQNENRTLNDTNGAVAISWGNPTQTDFHSRKIINVVDPVDAQDVATKAYVDANSGGGGSTSSALIVGGTTAAPTVMETGISTFSCFDAGSDPNPSVQAPTLPSDGSDIWFQNATGSTVRVYRDITNANYALIVNPQLTSTDDYAEVPGGAIVTLRGYSGILNGLVPGDVGFYVLPIYLP